MAIGQYYLKLHHPEGRDAKQEKEKKPWLQWSLNLMTGDTESKNLWLQLLDFAHGLGAIGQTAFMTLVKCSPLAEFDQPLYFRFPRQIGDNTKMSS